MNAESGIAGLLIQGTVPWLDSWTGTAIDASLLEDQLADIRRGLDILLEQKWIDRTRIAYAGHDYGAMFGAVLSGRDFPICAWALIAPSPRWGDWISYFNAKASGDKEGYDALFGRDEPFIALAKARTVPVLLQFASSDKFITESRASEFAAEVSEPKTVTTVSSSTHDSVYLKGQTDRLEFLKRYLISPP